MAVSNVLQFGKISSPYETVSRSDFYNHQWQDRSSIIRVEQLEEIAGSLLKPTVLAEMKEGLKKVGMSVRINPYIMELINWSEFEIDPIRRQFLPMASEIEQDHPLMCVDSLGEQETSPVPNLVHRYPDKVLFLVTSVCPVYCQFCTRSYAVGQDTETVKKDSVSSPKNWDAAIDYIRANPQIEDVVISGGDIARLKPAMIKRIGTALLDIEHVRRIRFATKALSVQPMKFISDEKWFRTLVEVANYGRALFKNVFIHSHFNHPREVTPMVEMAMRRLHSEGIYVRNQTVLLRGVNDNPQTLIELNKKLGRVNIQPYYIYSCDMVKSIEHFRVPVQEIQYLEREIRGATAGFNTPLFVIDAPGGGGKRDVHSYEYQNEEYGIIGYRSPQIDPYRMYYYFDPLRSLTPEIRNEWLKPGGKETILANLSLNNLLQIAAE